MASMVMNNGNANSYRLKSCLKVATLEESLKSCKTDIMISNHSLSSQNSLSRSLTRVRSIGSNFIRKVSSGVSPTNINHDTYNDVSQRTCTTDDDEALLLALAEQRKYTFARTTVIKFDTVTVREYLVSVSDNPSVSNGPALELSWSFKTLPVISVDQYESVRPPPTLARHHTFKLSIDQRFKILLKSGWSMRDIQLSTARCAKGRNLRRKTLLKINRAAAHGKLKQLDDHRPGWRKLISFFKSTRKPRKMETAIAY